MNNSDNGKQKILAIVDILKKYTDENHGIQMPEIIDKLNERGIKAERKSIYKDISQLVDYGIDVVKYKEGKKTYYSIPYREFDLPELKLMVDAVQSSKFISEKKSTNLIKKIEGLSSKYDAAKLQRQVFVANRVKTDYENVFYNIDELNNAINNNKQIDFQYFEWNLHKEMVKRPNGDKENISPWALMWDDENYYLVAYDLESKSIKHYRVDKMRQILIKDALRQGKDIFEKFDMAAYAIGVFNMFTGEEENVKIEFDNRLIGVVMDRFGKNVMIIPKGENKFVVNINIHISNMFLGWIIGLGSSAKILGPQSVVQKLKDEIKRLNEQYEV